MKPTNKKILLVVAGPTASGKTALAIELALHFKTEIISADSRQFYKELPIGTAAPTASELKQVKHHFIGNISITNTYDVATYEKEVVDLLPRLFEKNDIVILSGGSGLFIDAVCNGLDALPETTPAIRNEVQDLYLTKGLNGLQEKLEILDPEYFRIMDAQNPRRLQRALEVCLQSGKTFTSLRTKTRKMRPFGCIKIAIQTDRKELIERINQRVDNMMADGLLNEVKSLYENRNLNALNTVGYKELFDYLDGECTLDQAVEKIKISTRRYAKRQMTWFRKNDDYNWFSRNEVSQIIKFINQNIQCV
jgi:tRNA dimethylallyltransferase